MLVSSHPKDVTMAGTWTLKTTYKSCPLIDELQKVCKIGEVKRNHPASAHIMLLVVKTHDERHQHVGGEDSTYSGQRFLPDVNPWGVADA